MLIHLEMGFAHEPEPDSDFDAELDSAAVRNSDDRAVSHNGGQKNDLKRRSAAVESWGRLQSCSTSKLEEGDVARV